MVAFAETEKFLNTLVKRKRSRIPALRRTMAMA
jgi:hypothetical protein